MAQDQGGQRKGQVLCKRIRHRLAHGVHRRYGDIRGYTRRNTRGLLSAGHKGDTGLHYYNGDDLLPR